MSKLADARPWRKGPEVRYAHSGTLGQDERARRDRAKICTTNLGVSQRT